MKTQILSTATSESFFSNVKNIIFLCIIIATLSACGKSKEEKADELIRKYMLEEIYDYESYSPIESKFEEAYNVALNDSSCRRIAMNIVKMEEDYQEGMRIFRLQMEDAGLIQNGTNSFVYSEEDLKYYPDILETQRQIDVIDASISFEASKLRILRLSETGECIGYSVVHKFRYKDSFKNPKTGNYYFLFDKRIKNILSVIDLEDEKNQSMLNVLRKYCSNNE